MKYDYFFNKNMKNNYILTCWPKKSHNTSR